MTKAADNNSRNQIEGIANDSNDKPWKNVCSYGCYHARAKKKKCKCRCSGKLHGKAHARNFKEMKIDKIEGQRDQG